MAALVVQITHTYVLWEFLRRAIGNRKNFFGFGKLTPPSLYCGRIFSRQKRDKTGECCTKQCKNNILFGPRR